MKRSGRILAALLPLGILPLGICGVGFAQSTVPPIPAATLINLDTPDVLPKRASLSAVNLRAFGGEEDTVYTSVHLRTGVGHNAEVIVRGAYGRRAARALQNSGGSATLRHGGADTELALKYGFSPPNETARYRLAALVGVSYAATPAQSDAFLTLGAMASFSINEQFTLFLNPRAVLIDHNTIVGIGLGIQSGLGQNLSLVADYTPMISGDNTRDTTTGARKRRDIYGVALQTGVRDLAVAVGYTNATGTTTGFSLTPGLGGSGAFYLSLRSRR